MKCCNLINRILFMLVFLSSVPLLAFEGKVFSVTGNQVTITGEGVAHLKAGQKFSVFNGTIKTGVIVVLQASHTQAKAKVTSGTAAKDAEVREIVASVGAGSTPARSEIISSSFGGWSEYQGIMDWSDAAEKCAGLSMRLPTLEELNSAYASGSIELWKKDGPIYWTSTSYGDGRYYFLVVNNGYVNLALPGIKCSVRCRR